MAARELILADLTSVADLRSSAALGAIGRELDRDPDLRMLRFGTSDPPRESITSAEAALREWRPSPKDEGRPWRFHMSRKDAPQGRASVDVTTLDPTKALYEHSVSASYLASWFSTPERRDQLAALLIRLALAARAFYGKAALGSIFDQHNLELDRAGAPPPDYEREIPDIYWLNYFGPEYVDFFGPRLEGLGVRRERTPGGGVLIWATETPFVFEPGRGVADYEFKKLFYEALGRETFRSAGQRRGATGVHVPTHAAHSARPPGSSRPL